MKKTFLTLIILMTGLVLCASPEAAKKREMRRLVFENFTLHKISDGLWAVEATEREGFADYSKALLDGLHMLGKHFSNLHIEDRIQVGRALPDLFTTSTVKVDKVLIVRVSRLPKAETKANPSGKN